MHNLTLKPGAELTGTFEGEDGKPVSRDVSTRAIEFLFEPVTLAAGVTLADIFALLANNPLLVQVYRRDFVAELLAHALKGPLKTDNPFDPEGIEYLELYQIVELDTATKLISGNERLGFHGMGFEQRDDVDMGGYIQPKGSRIQWGISLTDVRELLHLPVRVNREVTICEGDLDAKRWGEKLDSVHLESVTLGQVLHGILWELSFHGGPSEQTDVRDDLVERKAEVDEALEREKNGEPSGLISGDDLFEEFDRPGVEAVFETIGDLRARDITRALRQLDDDTDVEKGLALVLGEMGQKASKVRIKAEFKGLTARAFRRAMRQARH